MSRPRIGIIGGGASGMMAAIMAAGSDPDLSVVLIEQHNRVGKKLLATGNGRCNLTNLDFSVDYYRGSGVARLKDIFAQFGVEDTLRAFHQMGLLTMDRNGYVYPLSQQASSVLDVLRFEMAKRGVNVTAGHAVRSILHRKNKGRASFLVFTDAQPASPDQYDRLILSCGSPAGLPDGAGLDGYRFARSLGHSVTALYPALGALCLEGKIWNRMAGARIDARVCLYEQGREEPVASERGEVQLTSYGISGIPVFQLSREAAVSLAHSDSVWVGLDFLPAFPKAGTDWTEFVNQRIEACMGRPCEVFSSGLVHKKVASALLGECGLAPSDILASHSRKRLLSFFTLLRNYRARVLSCKPLSESQSCAGGVPLGEVTDQLQSRLVHGLYFTGELLDVDARCGGYNLQWAWTSGAIAGLSAARSLRSGERSV